MTEIIDLFDLNSQKYYCRDCRSILKEVEGNQLEKSFQSMQDKIKGQIYSSNLNQMDIGKTISFLFSQRIHSENPQKFIEQKILQEYNKVSLRSVLNCRMARVQREPLLA